MESQVAVAVAEELAEEALVVEALEDHKQLIIQVDKAWTEQVQAEAETITLVETAQREVRA
jgi:hypothetical protein